MRLLARQRSYWENGSGRGRLEYHAEMRHSAFRSTGCQLGWLGMQLRLIIVIYMYIGSQWRNFVIPIYIVQKHMKTPMDISWDFSYVFARYVSWKLRGCFHTKSRVISMEIFTCVLPLGIPWGIKPGTLINRIAQNFGLNLKGLVSFNIIITGEWHSVVWWKTGAWVKKMLRATALKQSVIMCVCLSVYLSVWPPIQT